MELRKEKSSLNSIFEFKPHSSHPEIEMCRNTGVHRYKGAKHRIYQEGYFLEEYRSQYNKTYFEDEKNLRELAQKRLSLVSQKMGWVKEEWKHKKILEIGSATGFFLHEASLYSDYVKGVEISLEAAEYGRKILGLSIQVGDFLDEKILSMDSRFDAIFSFFTIEHISQLDLLWNKISHILSPKGVIMLGLPSFHGPTYVTNPREWFRTHPEDHFYDYSPQSLKKVLKHYGIVPVYNKPLSYHKYRDKGWRGVLPNYFYKRIADWQCYGDTFQIIAKKL